MKTAVDDQPVFMRPGHCAGDLVEAADWNVLTQQPGLIEVDAHLPARVLNPRGQLFGGFTGTYVDLVAIFTARTLFAGQQDYWVTTVNMRIDYLAPVLGPRMRLKGELINQGRSTLLVSVIFMSESGEKLVYALVTLKIVHKPE